MKGEGEEGKKIESCKAVILLPLKIERATSQGMSVASRN